MPAEAENFAQDSPIEDEVKKSYTTPELTVYGDVRKITEGSPSGFADGGTGGLDPMC